MIVLKSWGERKADLQHRVYGIAYARNPNIVKERANERRKIDKKRL
jgi:hypothetical protein